LPAGTTWYDFWTNDKIVGGQEVAKVTRIDEIPLYVKAGTIIPFGPQVQFVSEKRWDNLEIRIYPGADGEFTLYEDENDNYNYEKGAYSTITFKWNDAQKKLTIEERKGAFTGMLTQRQFNIALVAKGKNSGMDKANVYDKVVRYAGKKVSVGL
jgi:alpha-D-xyloside xylohydrolase